MKGRKPTPTRIKLVKGNPGKRKLSKKEPQFDPSNPRAPVHLSRAAKQHWRRIVPQLYQKGVSTDADYLALVGSFDAYDDYVTAKKAVDKEGQVITLQGSTGRDVVKTNPAYEVMKDAWKRYMEGFREFGMTPSSRTRVSVVKPQKEEDPFAVYEGGKK